MRRSLMALCTAATMMLATAARADVPYWQVRYAFQPFARAIAVDPSDPNVVWVAASNAATHFGDLGTLAGTGVFRSTDGGQTFAPRNTGLPSGNVTALAVDPSNPNVAYAGLDAHGVAKTTDAGTSWTPVSNGLTALQVLSVVIHPTTPDTVYAGTKNGAFRSIDGGATWTKSAGTAGSVWAFAVHPAQPATVYVASGGVAKSTDGGASYADTGDLTVPPNNGNTGPVVYDVRSIVIDATAPDTLLVGAHEGGGVFRSTDGGASWTHASTGLRAAEYGNWRFVNVVAQDPVAPTTFYATTTDETYRSVDGGLTWVLFSAGLSRGEAFALGVHPSGAVYIGSVFGELHRLAVKPSIANHFRCFKARGESFTPQPLPFDDAFAAGTTSALRPVRYCVPTAPESEAPVDPASHLVCYKTSKIPQTPMQLLFRSQRIDGYRAYRVERSETVCVPATVGGPGAGPREAYRCLAGPHYKSYPLDLMLSDALGTQYVVNHRTDRLCFPTDVEGTGVLEPGVELRCDIFKSPMPRFTKTQVTTTDRFGTRTFTLVNPDTHRFQALDSRL